MKVRRPATNLIVYRCWTEQWGDADHGRGSGGEIGRSWTVVCSGRRRRRRRAPRRLRGGEG